MPRRFSLEDEEQRKEEEKERQGQGQYQGQGQNGQTSANSDYYPGSQSNGNPTANSDVVESGGLGQNQPSGSGHDPFEYHDVPSQEPGANQPHVYDAPGSNPQDNKAPVMQSHAVAQPHAPHPIRATAHGIGYAGTTALGAAGLVGDAVKGTLGLAGKAIGGTAHVAAGAVKGVVGLGVGAVKGVGDLAGAGIRALHDKGANIESGSISKSTSKPNAQMETAGIENKDRVMSIQQEQQQEEAQAQNQNQDNLQR